MDLLAELTQVKADLAAAQALVDTNGTSLQAALDAQASIQSAFDAFKADSEAKIAQAALDLAAKQEELAALQVSFENLKAEQKTADEKANDIVAGLGIAQVKVDVSGIAPSLTADEARKAYAELKDPDARADYYAKHRALFMSR
jgi:hypothetical protein